MGVMILALLFIVIFHKSACAAAHTLIEAFFDAIGVVEERFAAAILDLTAWLRRPGLPDPTRALVGLFLVALTATVAVAEYTALLASLGIIWPTDAPPARSHLVLLPLLWPSVC